MKPLLKTFAVAIGVAALSGCGAARKSSSEAGAAARPHPVSISTSAGSQSVPHYPGVRWFADDSDGDADHNSDENMLTPGHEGTPRERRAIARVVSHYYSVALADDGPAACAMLAASLATSMLIEYGRYGAPYLRGKTCAGIMSKLFRHQRRQVVAVASTEKLIDVRLEGDHGYAALHVDLPCLRGSCVLNAHTLHIANVLVERDGDTWKIDSLLAIV
jgi:hypothetical protein